MRFCRKFKQQEKKQKWSDSENVFIGDFVPPVEPHRCELWKTYTSTWIMLYMNVEWSKIKDWVTRIWTANGYRWLGAGCADPPAGPSAGSCDSSDSAAPWGRRSTPPPSLVTLPEVSAALRAACPPWRCFLPHLVWPPSAPPLTVWGEQSAPVAQVRGKIRAHRLRIY